ncbi:prepilin peptidase [Frondihabitans sucicola]|uniref:Prepilin peptidase n=1 Tax=Frondihabitans sucicola TaxID=1268041 RepID=A0ABN6XVU2_9MICO|nr:A24 family peptidase [Frondihabitans sucicola]BDZ49061.1 prepilin peptidase [Frondihabitans sucicola]
MTASLAWILPIGVAVGGFGLLIGSFLNVVVYRLPNGMSLSTPPSACPGCGSRIKAYDNVPVLSWLALQGKCRGCKKAISARYPLVELGTAAFFFIVGLRFVPRGLLLEPGHAIVAQLPVVLAFLYLAAISVALGLIDVDVHRLPNAIVLPSYVAGVVLFTAAAVLSGEWDSLIRGLIGLAVLWVAYAGMALAYPGGMGFGDVKLAGVLGLYLGWLGWGPLIVGAFAAFLLGGLFSLILLGTKRVGRKGGIPFGPWMLVGAWVGIFLGPSIWAGYLSFLGFN